MVVRSLLRPWVDGAGGARPDGDRRPRGGRANPFRRHGHYATRRRAAIPRFRCGRCGRTFSRQSFAVSYYLKRPELVVPVATGLQAGSAHALQHMAGHLSELLVLDHFETFEFTQDWPFGVATPVGADSWFVYGLDPAPHRRTLDLLLPLAAPGRSLDLRSDGHPTYDRAAERLGERVVLQRFPNPRRGPRGTPRSLEMMARDQAMFPADSLHALLRHTLAHHRSETIAFGRRVNALMERLFLAVVWCNFVKGRSERRPDPNTPAMRVGLTDERWGWRRDWHTPLLASNTHHRLAHAY